MCTVQVKVLLKRLVSVEEKLVEWQGKAKGLPKTSRTAKYVEDAVGATGNAVRVLAKLEAAVCARSGHERLAGPGECTVLMGHPMMLPAVNALFSLILM